MDKWFTWIYFSLQYSSQLTKSIPTLAVICTLILFLTSRVKCERWSRQVTNSEWIPLTNPKSAQRHQIHRENVEPDRGNGLPATFNQEAPQIQQIALSPALQLQYQAQLLQLQRTQDNILKLLSLQQQIKNQQQLIQVKSWGCFRVGFYFANGIIGK